ncbi:recombinase family protein [Enterococcus wangshanyuanii]|uniref:Recombinase family protein n=1 Tax=Enterococcus wangshanyuanii TaxID=2005703 RepID=A0ABQ1PFI5_9ENTE|nr:recombinase family protein [Enterococcus wangshanyuanii]GGC96320.1 hypothetical protein GCM10011573_27430 [Enterococcus wangshanyuanii]
MTELEKMESKEWLKKEKLSLIRNREVSQLMYDEKRQVEIVPSIYEKKNKEFLKKRVAAYCRVSTYEESQEGSLELQIKVYTDKIMNNPDWEFAGVYADRGASGTTMKSRYNFQRLLEECRNGNIDLVLVKSISRFTRNTLHFISINREFKALSNPVGIYIEDMGINTLSGMSEYILNMMSVIAQGESEQKSNAIKWAYKKRWEMGIPFILTNNLLGYTKDDFGKVIIDEEEAEVVRFIYRTFIDGASFSLIARLLTQSKVPTPTGRNIWSPTTVGNILKNEKYCGDVIMQKSYTIDCFSHRRRKNNGEKRKYILRDAIPPIVSKLEWNEVQRILSSPYRNRAMKNTLNVSGCQQIVQKWKTGVLKGFLVFDPSWSESDIEYVLERKE